VAALDTVFPAVRNRISLKNKIRNYYKISDLQKSGAGLFKMLSMLLVKSTKLAWSKIDRLFFEKRKMEERSRRMAESYKKIEEKFRDGERGFNKSEKRLILKRAMVGYRMQFLDFPIIYFRALRTTNQASVMFLKQNARLVNEVAMNCMHVDFVKEAYACETARHLERYLQE
jgi:predicted nuclease with TOPRIM domain